jgi:hypothetical protein
MTLKYPYMPVKFTLLIKKIKKILRYFVNYPFYLFRVLPKNT